MEDAQKKLEGEKKDGFLKRAAGKLKGIFKGNQNENGVAADEGDQVRHSRATDSEYMEAVNSGDMEAAQRMVDEAAFDAGYTEHVYHGTTGFGFTKIDRNMLDQKAGMFVTNDERVAKTYSG